MYDKNKSAQLQSSWNFESLAEACLIAIILSNEKIKCND